MSEREPTAGGRRWSLRARLLAGVLALVLVALVAFGLGTAALLRDYQLDRADTQLRELAAREPMRGGRGPAGARRPDIDVLALGPGRAQPGSISLQLLDANGRQIEALPAGFVDDPDALPDLPPLAYRDLPRHREPFTVGAEGDTSLRYRVLVESLHRDQTLVMGVPLARDDATINRLLVLEAVGAAFVLLAVGVVGFRVIRVGLRPLDDMTDTATAIAAGDLARRVGAADERPDEIGAQHHARPDRGRLR